MKLDRSGGNMQTIRQWGTRRDGMLGFTFTGSNAEELARLAASVSGGALIRRDLKGRSIGPDAWTPWVEVKPAA